MDFFSSICQLLYRDTPNNKHERYRKKKKYLATATLFSRKKCDASGR